jgi:hypothetical protein
LIAHVQDLTRRDIKAVYLKQLQGGFCQFLASHSKPAPFCLLLHHTSGTAIVAYAESADDSALLVC